jgi:mannose-6-phosphate isomerase-like protein (cupin superfamily)
MTVDPNAETRVVPPGEHEAFDAAGDRYVVLTDGATTDGSYCLMRAILPPGGGPPTHVHDREDERFDILSGQVTFFVGGKRILAGPGTSVFVPKGVEHAFRNGTGERAEMLLHVHPSGLENFFREIGRPVVSLDDPIPPMDESQVERMRDLAPRFGITIIGHPEGA